MIMTITMRTIQIIILTMLFFSFLLIVGTQIRSLPTLYPRARRGTMLRKFRHTHTHTHTHPHPLRLRHSAAELCPESVGGSAATAGIGTSLQAGREQRGLSASWQFCTSAVWWRPGPRSHEGRQAWLRGHHVGHGSGWPHKCICQSTWRCKPIYRPWQ